MLSLLKPTPERLTAYVQQHANLPLSYSFVGATKDLPQVRTPAGFVHDHRRTLLGSGNQVWNAARQALDTWAMFQTGWTTLHAPQGAPRPDNVVALVIWYAGFWWVNPTRVVYLVDEPQPGSNKMRRRFGFGYGTVTGHVECGEERFLLEQDDSGQVWFDLTAFSRPRHPLVRLANPLTRRLQKAFGRDSAIAMQRATSAPT
jgi:uncharacterized protein (UPF0548 family)